MKRNEILKDYTVSPLYPSMINSPGTFEGEQIYMPHFYNIYLSGFADETGRYISVKVTPEDRLEFPELKRRKRIRFIISDQGFVCEV